MLPPNLFDGIMQNPNIEIPDILQEYVDNKAAIRRRIAQETQCTIEQVKRPSVRRLMASKSEIMETSPWIPRILQDDARASATPY